MILIQRMVKYPSDCSLKFIKKPLRLDLRFEKSFTLAVKENKQDVLELFPRGSVKSVYVSMHALKDYKKFKLDKSSRVNKGSINDVMTTPLHIAAECSNIEAVRTLIQNHNFDLNILIKEKNFLIDLLETAGFRDFSILNVIFSKKRPCINSGEKLPLNQAILRGNPYIVKTLMEKGKPNPYTRDAKGKSPLHMAAVKLDSDTFESFVEDDDLGCDPLLPDADGNTWIHTLAIGTITDREYDFIKKNMLQYGLRLTRNKENRTALNTIKSYSGQALGLRGQPNFKRKIWEWFEMKIQ